MRGLDAVSPAVSAKLPPDMSIHGLLAADFILSPPSENWTRVLPSFADFSGIPFFWPEEAQKLLPGAAKHLLENQQTKFHRDWEQLRRGHPRVALDDYKHAWFIVSSRSFYQETPRTLRCPWEDRVALMPVADLFNHAAVGCKVSYSEEGYEITADRDYHPGDEICTSYGNHTNDFLLVEYGFVLDDSTCDRFDPVDLISSALGSEEAALLWQMRRSPAYQQVCGPATEEGGVYDDAGWDEEDQPERQVDHVRLCQTLASKCVEEIKERRREVSTLGDGSQLYQRLLLERWDQIDKLVQKAIRLSRYVSE